MSAGLAMLRPLGLLSRLEWARAATGFQTTGLGGGGGVDCIGIEPGGSRIVAGGDNSGPKQSINSGAAWTPAAGGLPDKGPASQSCAVEWDPATPGRVWLATKQTIGGDGGFFMSSDGGLTWALISSVPQFEHDPDNVGRPRIVGRLIAVTTDGSKVYLGGVDGVVWRYDVSLGGSPVAIASLSGQRITSIGLDPVVSATLFVATRTQCWKVTNTESPSATAHTFAGSNAPRRTEELVVVKEGASKRTVYAAAWTNVLRIDGGADPATGAWKDITPTSTTSTDWCSIDAVRKRKKTIACIGSSLPGQNPHGGFDPIAGLSFDSVFISANVQASVPVWTPICSGDPTQGVLANQNGGGVSPWWGYLSTTQGGVSENRLGTSLFVPEQIRFKPRDITKVYVVGTQGVFMFDRAALVWYPMMVGLGVTTNNSVHCDPNDQRRVYVTNTDHVLFLSTDRMTTARKNENPGSLPNNGFCATFDRGTTPSRVYLAVGDDTNTGGGIFSHSDPSTFADWQPLDSTGLPINRPLGLAVRRIGAQVIVIAAVQDSGIYRRRFDLSGPPIPVDASWNLVNGTAMAGPEGTTQAPMTWENSQAVYLFDRNSGVWRSLDQGGTWSKIWAATNDTEGQGFVDADPDDSTGGTLYVSLGANSLSVGVWRLVGCQVAGATVENALITKTELKKPGNVSFTSPGPIVSRASNKLYVVENSEPNVYSSIDDGASWTAAGDAFYARAGKRVSGMDVGTDGRIYVALRGPGLIRSI